MTSSWLPQCREPTCQQVDAGLQAAQQARESSMQSGDAVYALCCLAVVAHGQCEPCKGFVQQYRQAQDLLHCSPVLCWHCLLACLQQHIGLRVACLPASILYSAVLRPGVSAILFTLLRACDCALDMRACSAQLQRPYRALQCNCRTSELWPCSLSRQRSLQLPLPSCQSAQP